MGEQPTCQVHTPQCSGRTLVLTEQHRRQVKPSHRVCEHHAGYWLGASGGVWRVQPLGASDEPSAPPGRLSAADWLQ